MKATEIKVGDQILLDVGYGGPDFAYCEVIGIEETTALFHDIKLISFHVKYGSETFWTSGFELDDELDIQ